MFYGEPEGTGFEAIDPRFNECLTGHGRVERLWTGARWAEGPAVIRGAGDVGRAVIRGAGMRVLW